MAESNRLLKILVKECTRSLECREGVFSFPIRNYIDQDALRSVIESSGLHFSLNEINAELGKIRMLGSLCRRQELREIAIGDLIEGETLEVELQGDTKRHKLVKVSANSVLLDTGESIAVTADCALAQGKAWQWCPTLHRAVVSNIWLLESREEHAVVSYTYLDGYFRHKIAYDLQPIRDLAGQIKAGDGDYDPVLKLAKHSGIGAFQLLNLLNIAAL